MVNEEYGTRKSSRPLLALLGGVLLGGAVGYLVFFGLPPARVDAPTTPVGSTVRRQIAVAGLETGSQAPDFELSTPDGNGYGLQDHLGEVVLINFWATWCVPCRTEMPLLESAYQAFKEDGFVVLAVNFDETAEQVIGFREELGLTFPLLLDPGGKVQALYKVRGYPTTVILDREGRIYNYHIGIMTQNQLNEFLEGVGLSQ